jgi:aldose sugar dehydrogenase
VYGGDRFPAWRGSLLGGGLVSADVRRLEVDERGRIVAEERIPIGARVRDVRQGPDGFVYVLTDERDGEILRLEPAR